MIIILTLLRDSYVTQPLDTVKTRYVSGRPGDISRTLTQQQDAIAGGQQEL